MAVITEFCMYKISLMISKSLEFQRKHRTSPKTLNFTENAERLAHSEKADFLLVNYVEKLHRIDILRSTAI